MSSIDDHRGRSDEGKDGGSRELHVAGVCWQMNELAVYSLESFDDCRSLLLTWALAAVKK